MQNKPEISVNSVWALCFGFFHSILKKKKKKNREKIKIKRMEQICTKKDSS